MPPTSAARRVEPDAAPELPAPRARAAGDSPKSRRTRAHIVDTAVRLLVERGYAAAPNPVIAEAAGLTRGAMLYHFPDRASLVGEVVDHLQRERTRLFQAAEADAPHGADRTDHAIDSYWGLLTHPAFVAFGELEAAARTDPELAALIAPARDAFDRAQLGDGMFALVQGGASTRLQASRDLARFMLEGLARARLADDGDGRTERLLAVVKRAARMLNRKGEAADLWPYAH
ncbi:MAG: TetR family transcriptional regulator [Caulobacteraceae bacterium]|nr:TetR family transcriptional regulator [Caulobacter sp.]